MIKAVVYDLDGMVFEEPRYYTEDLKLRFGLPLKVTVFAKDPTYLDCKKGKIAFHQFFKKYYEKWKEYPKYTITYQEAIKDWFGFAKINTEIIEIAKKLKHKGIVNLILTNNTRARVEYLDKKHGLSQTFAIIGSYDLGVLKPDPKFYRVLDDKYHLKPKEVFYFDNKKEHVQGFKKMGFKTAPYKGIGDFKKKLKEANLTPF